MVCTGNSQQVNEQIQKFHSTPEVLNSLIQKDSNTSEDKIVVDGKKYKFGHRLLQSALLSNIVYPVRTQGQYIRHFTPGKNWNSLYTWDYFYNSGGWDDYPPQHALRDKASVTPVVTSAYYIRAAKILRLAAKELGLKKDVKEYEQIIKQLSNALQTYSWDEETGYFGYVMHNSNGKPIGIYRYKDGSNFNKGLDSISLLIANISSPKQTDRMINHIFSPNEMWTEVGISTVDQSAPYYRTDGYWNGAVWFPYQWMIWKALLDLGEGEKACQVATTALNT
ncbi:MGH1-like glycoside hydrolase domain-containing protein [Bacteroides sp.]|uniref:MGH1-like glycoside hydrolase domain-containing protein n=1 Tax=Bacteroides sp. TaxID=29523 RepID=UPI00402883CF